MTIFILLMIGLSAGLLSGLFGVGGGVFIVPSLVYGLGFSQKMAVGTSLAILLPPVGIAAVLEYHRHGHVDIKAALIIALMVLIGSWLGAQFAQHIDDRQMKLMFGVFLVILGGCIILNALKRI